MEEGTTSLGVRAQSAIARAAVLYNPRLATFIYLFYDTTTPRHKSTNPEAGVSCANLGPETETQIK
jgi:hypothetical protein